jgi:hypothetical protein
MYLPSLWAERSEVVHSSEHPDGLWGPPSLSRKKWPEGQFDYNRPDHDQQHYYDHARTVKPEAATAVVELLMMDVRTPETC